MKEATAAAVRLGLPGLALPLGLLALALAGGLGAVSYAESLVGSARVRLAEHSRQRDAARQRLANAGAEKDVLLRFRGTYEALGAAGFVGAEQRINWVDGLRAANEEAKLFGVEYQIDQQSRYEGAASLGVSGLDMRQSAMRIRLPLLQEGDLMTFIRSLAARRSGVFTLDSCTLNRTAIPSGSAAQPTLWAECRLTWITVAEAESQDARP